MVNEEEGAAGAGCPRDAVNGAGLRASPAAAPAWTASASAPARRHRRRRLAATIPTMLMATAAAVAAASLVVLPASGFVPLSGLPGRHAAACTRSSSRGSSSSCSSSSSSSSRPLVAPPPLAAAAVAAARRGCSGSSSGNEAGGAAAPAKGGKRGGKKLPPPPPAPVCVQLEQVVEVWKGGQVAFGNFEGRPDPTKGSVRVRLEHGETVAVDAGQLTGVWPTGGEEAEEAGGFLADADDAAAPSTPEGWAALRLRAGKAMRGLTPRVLELEAFWSLATQRWKRAKLPVDSSHLAAFLFHRKEYERAVKAEAQAHSRQRDEAAEGVAPGPAPPVRLPPVTPAQRYAASVLLASESFRFKRCVPTLKGEGDVSVVGPGYRPLEPSVVHSREVLSFTQAVRAMEERRKLLLEQEQGQDGAGAVEGAPQQGQWDAAQWRMLHHLEVFALGAGVEGLSSTSKQVLAALGEEATPEGARSVLLRAGYWSSTPTSSAGGGEAAPETAAAMSPAPWPEETLGEAKAALERAQKRRQALEKVATPLRPGRKGPHGRHDYRAAGLGAYALDPPGSEFADDALSWDPETGEVLVHIADVQSLLDGSPRLEEAARQRGEALYLPDGPLHLLPPAALQAASLSDRDANECVTAAFTLDPSSGQVVNARLLLTLIPPITRIRYDEANELLSVAPEQVPPHRKQAAKDLHQIQRIAELRRELTQRDFSEGRRVARVKRNAATGQLEAVRFERTAAHLMVDELLALYSEAGRRFLKAHSATLPLAPGSVSGGMDAARFGTGPLRRYTDVLAQKQISAVLKGQAPLSKQEIVQRMTQVNFQTKASRQLRAQSRTTVLLESFATFCAAQARAAKGPYAVVRATATGTGTEVVLPDVGLRSHVKLPGDWRKKGGRKQKLFDLEAGREFDVKVLKVDPKTGAIDLEFSDPERDAVFVEYEEEEDEEW